MNTERQTRQKAIVEKWGEQKVEDYQILYCGLCRRSKSGNDCWKGLLPITLDGSVCPYFEEKEELVHYRFNQGGISTSYCGLRDGKIQGHPPKEYDLEVMKRTSYPEDHQRCKTCISHVALSIRRRKELEENIYHGG